MPQINESTLVHLDSTFQPDPPEGWFGLGNSSGIQPPILALDYFQTAPWFHVAFDSSATSSDVDNLGNRDKAASVANPLGAISALAGGGGGNSSSNTTLSPALTMTIDNAIIGIISNAVNQSGWKGILGDIDPMLFFNVSVNRTIYTKFINQPDHQFNPITATQSDSVSQISLKQASILLVYNLFHGSTILPSSATTTSTISFQMIFLRQYINLHWSIRRQ